MENYTVTMSTVLGTDDGEMPLPPKRVAITAPPDDTVAPLESSVSRSSPEESDSFPHPPLTFDDKEGREIDVREFDGDLEGLLAMYGRFDNKARTQGIPPRTESRRRSWLEGLLEGGIHLVALHAGRIVGHAALIPMDEDRHELIVFVRPEYQLAAIGSHLVRCLLGAGRSGGVDTVWLSVGKHNRVAKQLYQSVGFEAISKGLEWEMERSL